MFVELLGRLLEFVAIVFFVRFVLSSLFGGGRSAKPRAPWGGEQFRNDPSSRGSSEARVISGEMKKDPQCGTYVSTELSLKSKIGGEVLHFCSRRCQEEFLQARSSKPA